ncbi:MAG: hypothetical protein JRJ24_10385 [Deltaproteobacteria bacterium]|nr:hypothetical protein [Deltaproteobacteria bacterium]
MDESESLEYEFHETSGGRLSTLPMAMEPEDIDLTGLQGARVVILDSELRAEKLAQVLSARGVQIAAADFSTAVIPRIREVDPQVVVLDSVAVGGQGIEFVRAMRKDPQLRWFAGPRCWSCAGRTSGGPLHPTPGRTWRNWPAGFSR